jgi:hypothetical protein
MSLKTRIDKLETTLGRGERHGVLEVHISGDAPCPLPVCSCLNCDRPEHPSGCRVSLRTPIEDEDDLIRIYDSWPCRLD